MKFTTAAERFEYNRLKRLENMKKYTYYQSNAASISDKKKTKRQAKATTKNITGGAERTKKCRERKKQGKEKNRNYQIKHRTKHSVNDLEFQFKHRMEKCRILKKVRDVIPGSPKSKKRIFTLLAGTKSNTKNERFICK